MPDPLALHRVGAHPRGVPFTLEDLEERLLLGSTLVEGSTLTEDQARAVLAGRTVVGHPVHEIREVLNHRAATAWLIEELQQSPFPSVSFVLDFHRRLMDGLSDGAGRFKTQRNHALRPDGSRVEYLAPGAVPEAMRAWIERFDRDEEHPAAERAAALYADFQRIHPFEDGNGRVGRMLLAYWLHWKHGLAFRFVLADRLEHLAALEASDRGAPGPLAGFIAARMRRDT